MRWLCSHDNVQQLILLRHADMKKLNKNSSDKQGLEVPRQVKHDPFMCLSRQMRLLATREFVSRETANMQPTILAVAASQLCIPTGPGNNLVCCETIQVNLYVHS